MRTGIGLMLAIGSALLVDPLRRTLGRIGALPAHASRAGAAALAEGVSLGHRIRFPRPQLPLPQLRPAPSGEPLRTKIAGSLALTLICVAVGAAIAHA